MMLSCSRAWKRSWTPADRQSAPPIDTRYLVTNLPHPVLNLEAVPTLVRIALAEIGERVGNVVHPAR